MELKKEMQIISKKIDRTSVRERKIQESIKKIQERIREGESTGNFIKDFCIKKYGCYYEMFFKKLNELCSNLKKYDKEIVMVEKHVEQVDNRGQPGINYFISPVRIYNHAELHAGLIKKPFLILKDVYIGLSTDKKVTSKGAYIYEGEILLPRKEIYWNSDDYKESILIEFSELFEVLRMPIPQNEFGPVSGTYTKSLNIIVGDSDVKKYFNDKKHSKSFENLERLLRGRGYKSG
ncbi:hypothetical protein HYT26_02160 [Candidatus Pacearchaeota archaeon]|nr:hypothetical protein [Candidatus Pacearchaeota archaeon]